MIDEIEFILKVSSRLQKFSRNNSGAYNFRCPYCGDSSKNKHKTRGYLFPVNNGEFAYNCFNCNQTANFYNFLNFIDPIIAGEYAIAKFKGSNTKLKISTTKSNPIDTTETKSVESKLIKCSDLHELHSARKYLSSRKIKRLDEVFFCETPKEWISEFSDSKLMDEEPKLVFPLKKKDGKDFGFVFRSIDKYSKNRYQTIIFDDTHPKCFGLETINNDKPKQYVVEGIMDCLSIVNSIAALDSALHNTAKKLNLDKDKTILIFDNEPRNKWVVRNIEKAINQGWKVFLWPKHIKQKDLNECLMENINIGKYVNDRTFQHQIAKLEFSNWKICY